MSAICVTTIEEAGLAKNARLAVEALIEARLAEREEMVAEALENWLPGQVGDKECPNCFGGNIITKVNGKIWLHCNECGANGRKISGSADEFNHTFEVTRARRV